MKTWQFEVDGQLHILKVDTQQSPLTATLDDKPLTLTSKLTQKGGAYSFVVNKHTGTIQPIQTEKGLRYGLLIDGKPVSTRPTEKADVKPLTHIPKYDNAGIFRRKQEQDEHRTARKSLMRQFIPDWTWVSIIGIMIIPAYAQMQTPAVILGAIGIVMAILIANIPKMKDIHRFAFTMMWMMFCWSAFVILASRGIIKIANIPLF